MLLDTLHSYSAFPEAAVKAVDQAYSTDRSANPEIKMRWLLFALKAGLYKESAAAFVQTVGRMK